MAFVSNNLFEFMAMIWVVKIALVFLLAVVIQSVELFIHQRLLTKFSQTRVFWDKAMLLAFHKPFIVLTWVLAASTSSIIVADHFAYTNQVLRLTTLEHIIILSLTVWFTLRFVNNMGEAYRKAPSGEDSADPVTVDITCKVIKLAVSILGGLIGLQMLHIPISGLLAFGGIGGAAVAFASKDLIGNLFGGLMIFLDRPFVVGDRICSASPKFDGTVESIGWRSTRIRALNKRTLYVPNGVFSTIVIENPSRITNRKMSHVIGVRYDDAAAIPLLVSAIDELLQDHEALDHSMTNRAWLTEFGPSSLNIHVNAYTPNIDWATFQNTQQAILLAILAIVAKHGAECAFPTQTIYLNKN